MSPAPSLRLVEPDESEDKDDQHAAHEPARRSLLRRRVAGTYDVDPWGLDHDLAEALAPVWTLRYDLRVDRPDRLPDEGPALLVANRRLGFSEPFVLARGVRQATGRHVRCVGVPDVQPFGSVLRRLGGVLARPDEVAGLLRAGEVVGVLLDRDVRHRAHAGAVPTELFAPAFELEVPVVPVALVGREVGRSWRVRLGEPVRHPRGRGPLAMAELAERARSGVQDLLDEALPPRSWM
jgi:1-acyl-sn-glycerol-3-phosphate acyltransferase